MNLRCYSGQIGLGIAICAIIEAKICTTVEHVEVNASIIEGQYIFQKNATTVNVLDNKLSTVIDTQQ